MSVVTTMTVHVLTPWKIPLAAIYNTIESRMHTIRMLPRSNRRTQSFRGIKRTILQDSEVPYGALLNIRYSDRFCGIPLSKRFTNQSFFLNVLMLSLKLDTIVTLTFSTQGKLMILGCLSQRQIQAAIETFISYIHAHISGPAEIFVHTVMVNSTHRLQKAVPRDEMLRRLIHDPRFAIFYSADGNYVGLNVRIAEQQRPQHCTHLRWSSETGLVYQGLAPFETFIAHVDDPKSKEKFNSTHYHSFFLFANGTVMQSSTNEEDRMWAWNRILHTLTDGPEEFPA